MIDAASREDLVEVSHYTTEPAAKRLERSHPLLAAKLHLAMALRILGAKKSKYYEAALGNLEKARKLLLREGQAGAWEALAAEIRSEHRRKTGFMPGFERVAEGKVASRALVRRARAEALEAGVGCGEEEAVTGIDGKVEWEGAVLSVQPRIRLNKAGPTRKVPGRKGMSWEEEDWVDEDATAHRGPDE